jgi:hypothetical protein
MNGKEEKLGSRPKRKGMEGSLMTLLLVDISFTS